MNQDNYIKLNVDYSDKEIAKTLGAKWDSVNKIWFIHMESDILKFTKWFESPYIDVFASVLYTYLATEICWKCGKETSFLTLLSDRFIFIKNKDNNDINKENKNISTELENPDETCRGSG